MLEIKELSFAYEKDETVKNVSFSVQPGELVCLLGANGSGKTTILKCLNGILKPSGGEILLDGVKINSLSPREVARLISMVPQEHTAVFSYQVIDIVCMGITPYLGAGKMPSKDDYNKAAKVLHQLGIAHLTFRNYNRLSGGERQLVLIARSLMQDTGYVVMDEPTSHLDFKNQHLLMLQLKKLAQKGKGIITALHDPNLALKFCDKVVIIKDGTILACGRTSEVMTGENLQRAYGIDILINDINKGVEVALPEVAG